MRVRTAKRVHRMRVTRGVARVDSERRMGRPRKQTDSEVLGRALRLFWARGFHAVSVAELEQAMGLGRGSFYLRFRGKRAVLLAALEHYREQVVTVRRQEIAKSRELVPAIRRYFDSLIEHSMTRPELAGCFNTNTAIELALADRRVGQRISRSMRTWEQFWTDLLKRARTRGELSASIDPKRTARLLVALTQGLNVLMRSGQPRSVLEDVVTEAMRSLTAARLLRAKPRSARSPKRPVHRKRAAAANHPARK